MKSKAEEGGDGVPSPTDDNAVLARIAGAYYSIIGAVLYWYCPVNEVSG